MSLTNYMYCYVVSFASPTAFNYLLRLFLICRLLRKALDKITEVKSIRENRRLGLYISVTFSPHLEGD